MRERRRAWRRGLEVRYTPYAEPGPSRAHGSVRSPIHQNVGSPLMSPRSLTEIFSHGFMSSIPSLWNIGSNTNQLLVSDTVTSPQQEHIHLTLMSDDLYRYGTI